MWCFALYKKRAQKLYPTLDFEGVEDDDEDNARTVGALASARVDDTTEVATDVTSTEVHEPGTDAHGSDVEFLQ